jgi:WS/DGAT/MGAT family acyltransferase
MSYASYERLSAMDASQLGLERGGVHMHMGGVSIFESGPLQSERGALDVERIERYVASRLHRLPRYRQKLAWTPLERHPVWVDDATFNLKYHVRYTALPRFGGERELKRLTGRIISQELDRGKPLWEMWFVDGLPDERVALITKIHHCMVDGVGGASLMTALMRTDRDAAIEPTRVWVPRPAPSPGRMLRDELKRRAGIPLAAARAISAALAEPRATWDEARELLAGVRESVATQFGDTAATPFNRAIGPHRRLDWASVELGVVKEIGKRLGGTVNDVVLAVFSGAVGRFLADEGVSLAGEHFKALVPVNMRDPRKENTATGNRVAFVIAELPVAEKDPVQRLERVVEVMRGLKESRMTRGTDALVKLLDATFPSLFTPIARLGSGGDSYNLVVTNIPGPQFPTYFLGAKQLETYPYSPLFAAQALTVTAFSYDGRLFWGFNSDWDALPELHDLVVDVQQEFERFREAAGASSGGAPKARAKQEPAA